VHLLGVVFGGDEDEEDGKSEVVGMAVLSSSRLSTGKMADDGEPAEGSGGMEPVTGMLNDEL
jgi:hypothetical protein